MSRGGKAGRGGHFVPKEDRDAQNTVFNRDFNADPETDQTSNSKDNKHGKKPYQRHNNNNQQKFSKLQENTIETTPTPTDHDPEMFQISNPRAGSKHTQQKSNILIPPSLNESSSIQQSPQQPISLTQQMKQYQNKDKSKGGQKFGDKKNNTNNDTTESTSTTSTTQKPHPHGTQQHKERYDKSKNDKNDPNDKSTQSKDFHPHSKDSKDQSHKHQHQHGPNKHCREFSFEKIKPFDVTNECMVCSHPIKIYAGSTCGHTDEFCGECLLKLRLFAKQTTSNTVINPITGEEEQHRATVLLKPEYLAQCEQHVTNSAVSPPTNNNNNENNNNNPTSPSIAPQANIISDSSLDVDFIAQCRSRDTVCIFCHTPITPLLLSKTPVKPSTYKLLSLLIRLNNTPMNSSAYTTLRDEIYILINITHVQAKMSKKQISTYLETSFIYNATLDLYTLPQDGIEFAELIENVASISCKKCIQYNDTTKYSTQRTLTTSITPDYAVTYQATPLIIPHKLTMKFDVKFEGDFTAFPAPDTTEPTTITIGDNDINVKHTIDFHDQTIAIQPHITTLSYSHPSFASLRMLHDHTQNQHRLEICTACYGVSHEFIHSRSLFNHKEIILHAKQNQHSFCTLCRHQCYDNDELYAHLIDPTNNHYLCRFCTTSTTVQNNDLSQHQSKQLARKQSFKFLKNKAAYVLHLYHEHFVCDHPSCKQFDPFDIKNTSLSDPAQVKNPAKMVVFSNEFDLHQHQVTAHQAKQKNKKVDLTSMFISTSNRTTPASATTTTTIQPGMARSGTNNTSNTALPILKDNHGRVIKNTIDVDDSFVYTRIVQLSSDTQSHTGGNTILQMTELGLTASVNGMRDDTNSSSSRASVEVLLDGNQPHNRPTNQQQYQNLFPTLGNSTHNNNPPVKPQQQAKKEQFPSFGGIVGGNNNTKNKNQELFPAFGSTKSTSSKPAFTPTPTSSTTKGPTTIVATSQPISNVTTVTANTNKKNTLQDFINWNRTVPSSTPLLQQPSMTKKKSTNQHRYHDYQNDDGDIITSVGYHYEPVGSSKASFAATMGTNYTLDKGQEYNDRKQLHGDRNLDFPSLLGTAQPTIPSKTTAQIADSTTTGKKNKKGNNNTKTPANAPAPITNAWGIVTVQPQPQQPKPKTNTNTNTNNNNNNNKNKVNNKSTNDGMVKNNKATNDGMVGSITNTVITQNDQINREDYEEQLQMHITQSIPTLTAQINAIMSNVDNKGKKAPAITALLCPIRTDDDKSSATPTLFETIFNHLHSLDMPKFIPSWSSLELMLALFQGPIGTIISSGHKKSILLLLQSISILLQSLCSEKVTQDIFYKNAKITALTPNQPTWKLITASIQVLNKTYTNASSAIPSILTFPDLDALPIINSAFSKILISTLQNSSHSIQSLNKSLIPLVNDTMNLSQRVTLYCYLHAYCKLYLFKTVNVFKLIESYLRSVDAQETL